MFKEHLDGCVPEFSLNYRTASLAYFLCACLRFKMWFLLPVVTQLVPSYFLAATMAPSTTLVSITLVTGSLVVSACACVIVSQFFDFGDFTLSPHWIRFS